MRGRDRRAGTRTMGAAPLRDIPAMRVDRFSGPPGGAREGDPLSPKLFLPLAAALLAPGLTPTAAPAQAPGDSSVVAPVLLAGYPEGIATRGNRVYVSGPAFFGLPLGSAYVQSYDIR